jgi:hypothetical protein
MLLQVKQQPKMALHLSAGIDSRARQTPMPLTMMKMMTYAKSC